MLSQKDFAFADAYIVDPEFLRDPSGCTAVAALITDDNRILVVSPLLSHLYLLLSGIVGRPTPAIRDVS